MFLALLLSRRRSLVLRLARSVVATLLVLGLAAGAARAQTVDPNMWSTNGTVNAIATAGNTIYLGGTFTYVGPYTGNFVEIDAGTGMPQPGWPLVNDLVFCSAPDGAGGWYIGGQFTSVGGVPRAGLAHIRADKSLDAWNPGVNGSGVIALAVSGSTVYAGGYFTSIGGQDRRNIAALDATTGLATAWNPGANDFVYTLTVSGSTVYVGGFFGSIGGQTRRCIAALDATTGLATAWNPGGNATPPVTTEVRTLVVSGSTVYAGGMFTMIGGQNRSNIVALDATTGLPTAWNPGADGGVRTLVLIGSTMYVGGSFTSIGGQARQGIAALDASTGLPTAWNPSVSGGGVFALSMSGSTVYAGGYFTGIGGQSRSNIAALDATTGLATAWNPQANDVVFTLAVSGSTVYAGGMLSIMGGQSRRNLAAVDATTGLATAWDPGADNTVLTLAVSGSTVYAGGPFRSIGGENRSRIGALDATTGLATTWNPGANDDVYTLAVSGSTVYAGGWFSSIGGQTRSRIAALDATTGLATAWNPGASGSVYALGASGSTVYAGGNFTSIGGQSRSNIAALDATTGLATAWNPGANGSLVLSLALSGPTVYVGGNFTSIGGQSRSRIAALDAITGLATAWDPNANGGDTYYLRVSTLAVGGSMVYAGGIFTSIRGQTCSNLVALNADGIPAAWDPEANGPVNALAVIGTTVYAGGNFTSIGGHAKKGFASIALDLPVPTLLARFEAEQTSAGIQLRWQFGEPYRVVSTELERAPRQVGPWMPLALQSRQEADATEALDETVAGGETYYYRLTANLTDGTRAVFGPISAAAVLAVKVSGLTGIVPNPASSNARIDFALVRPEKVRISVVDVTGREAALLADGPMAPGSYSMVWDGRKGSTRVPAGVYYVRWASAGKSMNRKLVVMP